MTISPVARLLALATFRRYRVALVVAAALLATGGTVALTALAAAHRTGTAADRALRAASYADVSVDVGGITDEQVDPLRNIEGVVDLSLFAYTAMRPVGSDFSPGIDITGVMPLDRGATRSMDRAQVASGRLPRLDRVDEILVNPAVANRLGVTVGDRIEIESYRHSEVLAVFAGGEPPEPSGARLEVTVVGIGRDLAEIVAADAGDFGVIAFSPAWFERFGSPFSDLTDHEQPAGMFRVLLRARLATSEHVGGFLARVEDIYGDDASTLFAEASSDVFADAEATLRVESAALLLFGLAAGLATMLAAGQALTRQQFLAAGHLDEVARAVGMRGRARIGALLLPSVAVVASGIAVASFASVALSGFFPRGLAGRLEPHPGMHLDLVVLVPGAVALAAVILVWSWFSAARLERPQVAGSPLPKVRLPIRRPEVGVGVRMALHAGRGGARVPSQQAVVGGVIGIAGVVAAVTFASSLDRLVTTPPLYGPDYDTDVRFQGDAGERADAAGEELAADDRVVGATMYGQATVLVRDADLSAVFVEELKGSGASFIHRGRSPASPSEAAVDPAAVPGPGPAVGDVVTIAGPEGSIEVSVVGHVIGTAFGDVVLPRDAGSQLGGAAFQESGVLVRWADDVDVDVVQQELESRHPQVIGVNPPQKVGNLERVRSFPYALAVFLAAIAVLAIGHFVASAVRRRPRDFAVLKALGFRRRRVRATVRWQALTVTMLAAPVGTVLGIVAGRGAWALVAGGLRVVYSPVVPPWAVVAVVAGAMAAAVCVAALPARIASGARTSTALQVE